MTGKYHRESHAQLPVHTSACPEDIPALVSGILELELSRRLRPHLGPFLDIGEDSTMTHYDIWAGNVMIDIDSDPPRVSGYIDVPGHFADYARELSFAMLFGVADRRFLEIYGSEHPFDGGFPLRVNIYNLRTNIKHIQMYPSQSVYREGAAENLQAIHRALDGA